MTSVFFAVTPLPRRADCPVRRESASTNTRAERLAPSGRYGRQSLGLDGPFDAVKPGDADHPAENCRVIDRAKFAAVYGGGAIVA